MIGFLKKILGIFKKKEVHVEKPVETVDNSIPWYQLALKEKGTSEAKNPERVIWYHSHTSLKKADWKTKTSWCASFISTMLTDSGYKSLKTAWARSYLSYGMKLAKPVKGCIMVFERNDPGGDSHVTLWTGEEDSNGYMCLGGNQRGDIVSIQEYPKSDLLGCRWPVKEDQLVDLPKPQVPAGPITFKADWDKHKDGADWTKFTVDALRSKGKRMLAMTAFKDESKYFTKKFKDMSENEKIQAFVMLISAMAYQESKFDPKCDYKEGFDDAKGNAVISKGLLQISKESANQSAYGGKIKEPNELWDPAVNLGLGVSILDLWLSKDGYIGSAKLGGGRYWSCLRDTSGSQAKIRAKCLALKF